MTVNEMEKLTSTRSPEKFAFLTHTLWPQHSKNYECFIEEYTKVLSGQGIGCLQKTHDAYESYSIFPI